MSIMPAFAGGEIGGSCVQGQPRLSRETLANEHDAFSVPGCLGCIFMLGAGACGKESMYSNWLCWPNVQVLALIQSCCCTLLLCPWLNS